MIAKLDYVPRLHEANLAHLIRDDETAQRYAVTNGNLWQKSRWWKGGPVLDQGREGACVGFGVCGEAAASPTRVPYINNAVASMVYARAKQIDEWEGVNYEGTSVRAGMLVGRENEWWDGFKWAKNMDDLRLALEFGPVVIGVTWFSGMYDAPGGGVTIGGSEVGGHCLLLTGYSPAYQGGSPAFRWRNSWGPTYGTHGNAFINPQRLNRILFAAGGEAAVPQGRHLGKG